MIYGWLEIVDDYGAHKYHVTRFENGCYYLAEKTLVEDHMLRYNENNGMIEEYKSNTGNWDVYSQYIYQASVVKNIKA